MKKSNSSNILQLLKAKKLSQQITKNTVAAGITEKELQEKVYRAFDEINPHHSQINKKVIKYNHLRGSVVVFDTNYIFPLMH